MALQSGVDLVAIASLGVYSETYGQADPGNIANLAASFGYLEDAGGAPPAPAVTDFSWFRKGWFSRLRRYIRR